MEAREDPVEEVARDPVVFSNTCRELPLFQDHSGTGAKRSSSSQDVQAKPKGASSKRPEHQQRPEQLQRPEQEVGHVFRPTTRGEQGADAGHYTTTTQNMQPTHIMQMGLLGPAPSRTPQQQNQQQNQQQPAAVVPAAAVPAGHQQLGGNFPLRGFGASTLRSAAPGGRLQLNRSVSPFLGHMNINMGLGGGLGALGGAQLGALRGFSPAPIGFPQAQQETAAGAPPPGAERLASRDSRRGENPKNSRGDKSTPSGGGAGPSGGAPSGAVPSGGAPSRKREPAAGEPVGRHHPQHRADFSEDDPEDHMVQPACALSITFVPYQLMHTTRGKNREKKMHEELIDETP